MCALRGCVDRRSRVAPAIRSIRVGAPRYDEYGVWVIATSWFSGLAQGRGHDVPTVLVTFEPHPPVVLAPDRAPVQLLSLDDRVAQALALGVDGVVVLPFTAELAAQPAADFVEEGLVGRLGVRSVVIGDNFRCGRAGEGDVAFLSVIGRRLGFEVRGVDLVSRGERTCSSTEVRRALAAGDVAGAFDLLGRADPRIAAMAG